VTSLYFQGVFPAHYNAKEITGEGKRLDAAHTHFIFVQGDAWEALQFRERLLAYISTIPIEMDADFTQCKPGAQCVSAVVTFQLLKYFSIF